MFGKKEIKTVCDATCRAAAVREEILFKVAAQGPRI